MGTTGPGMTRLVSFGWRMPARHVWSVLCERAYIDEDSHNLLLSCLEQLNVSAGAFPSGADDRPVFISFKHEIVSLWDELGTASLTVRVRVECPDGTHVNGQEATITGPGARRYRLRMKSTHFPFRGPGMYFMHVEHQTEDGFEIDASLPLEIVVVPSDAPSSEQG